jgi:hypothetical protein
MNILVDVAFSAFSALTKNLRLQAIAYLHDSEIFVSGDYVRLFTSYVLTVVVPMQGGG